MAIVVKEYSKTEFRILLANPTANTEDENFFLLKPMDPRRFKQIVKPIIVLDCRPYMNLEAYNTAKVLPAKVVQIILNKLALWKH